MGVVSSCVPPSESLRRALILAPFYPWGNWVRHRLKSSRPKGSAWDTSVLKLETVACQEESSIIGSGFHSWTERLWELRRGNGNSYFCLLLLPSSTLLIPVTASFKITWQHKLMGLTYRSTRHCFFISNVTKVACHHALKDRATWRVMVKRKKRVGRREINSHLESMASELWVLTLSPVIGLGVRGREKRNWNYVMWFCI